MNDRWQEIEKLYHSVLELDESQRKSFLDQTCSGDQELRREVESLLSRQASADQFIESSTLEVAAKLMGPPQPQSLIGRQLGSYQIVSQLGSGGMGVVYQARDTRLKRTVAIKVLPQDLPSDPERRERFVQEARAASSLNHPHIITVYDIGSEGDMDFIVMEYVSGKSLDQLIPRKGMRLNQALKLAVQMADAMAKAHSAGIIHRDLKPGNVMVSDDDRVKVLDFGLAKLTEVLDSGEGTTQIQSLTETGTIVGTASYMSPEQAEGKKVDARSDIFSFGSVLYEMVTGQKAFQSDSKLATLATIIKQEPKAVSQLVPDIPADLAKIINRCLRKDQDRRFQHMSDVKVELEELKEDSDSDKLAKQILPQPARRLRLWLVGLITLFLAVPLAVWLVRSTNKGPIETPMIAVPLTSYLGDERQPSFSPDGNQVAFSWNGEKQDNFDIYVKLIGSGTYLRLTTARERDSCPAWSPDGRSIAFIREGPTRKDSVYLVSPLGPPERRVSEITQTSTETDWPRGMAWTPDGKSLVVTDRNSDNEPLGLFLLSVESGERRRLTSPQGKAFVDSQPAFSPDGHTLAFIREVAVGVRDIYLLVLSEDYQPMGDPKRLTFEDQVTFRPIWTSAGAEIIFSSGQFRVPNLFRISASGSGKPQRLVGVGEDGSEAAISHRMKRLVYTREILDLNIWRLEVPGLHGEISPPKKLIASTRTDSEAQFSPDGKRIVFASDRAGSREIWICDGDGSNAVQLTSMGGYCGSPRWSPDGERIAFESNVDRQWEIYVIGAIGGKPKRLTNNPAYDSEPNWSRDGKWIYFASNRSGESQLWKMSADGGEAIQVTRKGGAMALESPDSQWVYYTKGQTATGLWKMPRDGGEETEVLESVDKLAFAVVNEGIYFVPRSDSSTSHSIQFFNFATKRTQSIATIESDIDDFISVSPDRRWILYSQVDQAGSDLMLVENFH
jgi:Tol biopolymer transport system component/predicted Ser/Thr protein kinase